MRPQPAVNRTVLIVVSTLAVVPELAAWLLAVHGVKGSWPAALAPFASATVASLLAVGLALLERKMAGERGSWPPALLGLPVVGAAAGLAFAAIDPAHHWFGNTMTGTVLGGIVALWRWGDLVHEIGTPEARSRKPAAAGYTTGRSPAVGCAINRSNRGFPRSGAKLGSIRNHPGER